jgi:hypothetical protein
MLTALRRLFGCTHSHTTFPQSPRGGSVSQAYVVCLDCGKTFSYNWVKMRVGSSEEIPSATIHNQLSRE